MKELSNGELRSEILKLAREYSKRVHGQNRPGYDESSPKFVPGETVIPYAARVFTEDEVEAAVGCTLDFWLTLGPEGDKFESKSLNSLGFASRC